MRWRKITNNKHIKTWKTELLMAFFLHAFLYQFHISYFLTPLFLLYDVRSEINFENVKNYEKSRGTLLFRVQTKC